MTVPSDRKGFKIDVPHSPVCMLADHAEPFVLHDGIDWERRVNGDRGGSTAWHRFRCNDPECKAILLVRWDVLTAFVNKGASA